MPTTDLEAWRWELVYSGNALAILLHILLLIPVILLVTGGTCTCTPDTVDSDNSSEDSSEVDEGSTVLDSVDDYGQSVMTEMKLADQTQTLTIPGPDTTLGVAETILGTADTRATARRTTQKNKKEKKDRKNKKEEKKGKVDAKSKTQTKPIKPIVQPIKPIQSIEPEPEPEPEPEKLQSEWDSAKKFILPNDDKEFIEEMQVMGDEDPLLVNKNDLTMGDDLNNKAVPDKKYDVPDTTKRGSKGKKEQIKEKKEKLDNKQPINPSKENASDLNFHNKVKPITEPDKPIEKRGGIRDDRSSDGRNNDLLFKMLKGDELNPETSAGGLIEKGEKTLKSKKPQKPFDKEAVKRNKASSDIPSVQEKKRTTSKDMSKDYEKKGRRRSNQISKGKY